MTRIAPAMLNNVFLTSSLIDGCPLAKAAQPLKIRQRKFLTTALLILFVAWWRYGCLRAGARCSGVISSTGLCFFTVVFCLWLWSFAVGCRWVLLWSTSTLCLRILRFGLSAQRCITHGPRISLQSHDLTDQRY